jgi:thiamine-monophosphate kinase
MPAQDPTERMSGGEDTIVREFFAPLAEGCAGALGLRDDCALIAPEPGTELVLKTDPIAEGIHYLADDAPEDIGWKALAVNVSDLVAKGATPLGYLMAVSFPEAPTRTWLSAFANGLREAQQCFGCCLLGGDTDRRPGPVTISITAIGAVPAGRMVRRGAARDGDFLFVSGSLGDAALGLALRKAPQLAAAWGLLAGEADHLRQRYRRPHPRPGLSPVLREHASAAMDISDGLAKDLMRMCSASGCAAQIDAGDIPLSTAAAKALAADPRSMQQVIGGGDDYEVLAAVPAAQAEQFEASASAAGVSVTRIGSLKAGTGAVFIGRDGSPLRLPVTGWDHF